MGLAGDCCNGSPQATQGSIYEACDRTESQLGRFILALGCGVALAIRLVFAIDVVFVFGLSIGSSRSV